VGFISDLINSQTRTDEYYLSLGKFVHYYARVESVTHLAFPFLTGTPLEKAQIIKSGHQLGHVISLTKSLMPLSKTSKKVQQKLLRTFTQMELISQFRHNVLHRGAKLQPNGKLKSTNAATMKTFDNYEAYEFDLSVLDNATADLKKILTQLVALGLREPKNEPLNPILADRALWPPWLYKPLKPSVPQKKPMKQNHAKTPARLLRPQSSRE